MSISKNSKEKKHVLFSVRNKEDRVCWELERNQSFFDLLFKLLDTFKIKKPDLFDAEGNFASIEEYADSYDYFYNEEAQIDIVYGNKRIFLIIRTKKHYLLTQFIEDNCEFYKNPATTNITGRVSRNILKDEHFKEL